MSTLLKTKENKTMTEEQRQNSFGYIIKSNVRNMGMYIALLAIILYFNFTTGGLFLSPFNINNLFLQTGYVAVLGIGMTLVIVIRHIDLSVGYVAGFLGALTAILLTNMGVPLFLTMIIVGFAGILVGLWNGFLIAKVGIPSFVATLAGMLLFRGALILTTKSETILVNDSAFKAIGNGHLPTFGLTPMLFTIILALAAFALFVVSELKNRNKKISYQFNVLPMPLFIAKIALFGFALFYVAWKLGSYKGIPWTLLILIIVLLVYHFITNKTVIGRHIYAVGGNPEAASLSGISVNKITYLVFASMGFLASLSGILYTARLSSASPSAGQMFELDAIAAAYIGGVSAAGGVGRVTGAVTGALVMSSLTSGMLIMNVGIEFQYMIRAMVLIAAVVFDVKTRNMKIK